VDVRDVALAHLRAAELPHASGWECDNCCCASCGRSLQDQRDFSAIWHGSMSGDTSYCLHYQHVKGLRRG
jgi:hypothetical protein